MTELNISNLPRIKPVDLKSLLLASGTANSLAVVDVRDSDYIGGHIKPSHNVPTHTHDVAMPELVRKLADKDIVVFTCMLSQQRGPSSALKYARERGRLLKDTEDEGSVQVPGKEGKGQRVLALEGGFNAWVQAGFGTDERITEGYRKELWDEEDD